MNKTVIVALVFASLLGFIYLQNIEIKSKNQKILNLQTKLQKAKKDLEAQNFEIKWSSNFLNALNSEVEDNETKKDGTFSSSF